MMDNTSRPADGEGVTWLHLAPPTPDRESPARRPDAWVDDMLNALRPLLTEPEGAICDQPRPVRRGGRAAALEAVSTIDPVAYARTRNQLDGAVTRLSPWLRHGVLSTAEIRDLAIGKVAQAAAAEKLVSELAWRDYWQRVYASLGEAIFDNLEEAAAPSRLASSEHVPDDVLNATTGMACIDGFARELQTTGFLHNHARMWLASWLIHARGVRWQAGAAWFLSHLLDADPASNTLSWQWVAGTFAAKPYIFNRENLERHTAGRFCKECGLAGRCDLEGSYEDLTTAWFTETASERPRCTIPPAHPWLPVSPPPKAGAADPLVWLTLDSLAETSPAASRYPKAFRVFLMDPDWLARERPSRLRLRFLLECLAEVDRLDIGVGPTAAGVADAARRHQANGVAVASTPCPFTRKAAEQLATEHFLDVVDGPPLVDARRVTDLGRFSRYWSKVRKSAMQPGCAAS
jgi:deoxyribodipyrimidine photo-lyase